MRLLFKLDSKDYYETKTIRIRNSSRAIIINNQKIAMVYSSKYDYYKFPGGGIEKNESQIEALIRETEEETGLMIINETIKEYGYVHRIQRSTANKDEAFIQDNYYYLCNVKENKGKQKLDDYESNEDFILKYVYPQEAIKINRQNQSQEVAKLMIEREAKVLELLISEGYFS